MTTSAESERSDRRGQLRPDVTGSDQELRLQGEWAKCRFSVAMGRLLVSLPVFVSIAGHDLCGLAS
jgi:hypothetical protein